LIISLSSFVALAANPVDGGISTKWFGAAGLFSAVIIGVVIVELAIFILNKGIKIKLPETVPPNIAEPLEAMLMNFIIFALVLLARQGFIMMGTSLPALIAGLFAPLFVASDTLWAVIVYVLVVRLLWFFGLHGGNISSAVVTPFITANMIANVNAYAAHEPLPCIFTIEWTQTWTVMGILGLCISLMIVAKSSQLKTIAAVGFVPAIFTIGEPITFGVPIVLNFNIFIPYITCFLLDGIIPYLLTEFGFISRTFIQLPGITPGLIESFLNALDWRAPLFWLALLALNVIIFIPFVKSYDRKLLAIELADEAESSKNVE
ncbi:MAG: PTS transporter subunit EIIC, partial [Bacilli bacterium]